MPGGPLLIKRPPADRPRPSTSKTFTFPVAMPFPTIATPRSTSPWIRSVPLRPRLFDLIDCLRSPESHPDTSGFKHYEFSTIWLDSLILKSYIYGCNSNHKGVMSCACHT